MNNSNSGYNEQRTKFSISQIMISILVVYTIFFPRDLINIKEILLFFTLFVCSPAIVNSIKESRYSIVILLGLILPAFEIFISVTIGDSSIVDAVSNGYVWLYLLLIPAIEKQNINIKSAFIFS